MKLRLSSRIYLLVGLAIAGLALVVGATTYSDWLMLEAAREVDISDLESIYLLSAESNSQFALVAGAPSQTDVKLLTQEQQSFEDHRKSMLERAKLIATTLNDPLSLKILDDIARELPEVNRTAKIVFAKAAESRSAEAATLLRTEASPAHEKLSRHLVALLRHAILRTMRKPAKIINIATETMVFNLAFGIVITLVLGFVGIILVRRGIVAPLRTIVDSTGKLVGGTASELGISTESLGDGDFFSLARAFEQLCGGLRKRDMELAEVNRHLEGLVEERTARLQDQIRTVSGLLDGMRQAVFSVTSDGTVTEPVSRYSGVVFGTALAGQSVYATVFTAIDSSSERFAALKTAMATVFGEDDIQWGLMEDQFPPRLQYLHPGATEPRMLRIAYSPIWDSAGKLERILFAVEDVTEIERLELRVRADESTQSRNLQILHELADNDDARMLEFFKTAGRVLSDCGRLLPAGSAPAGDNQAAILRMLHTLKGNARLNGFKLISEAVHQAEGQLSRDSIGEVQRRVAEYARLAKRAFRIGNELESEAILRIHRAMIELELPWSGRLGPSGPQPLGASTKLLLSELEDAARGLEDDKVLKASGQGPAPLRDAVRGAYLRSSLFRACDVSPESWEPVQVGLYRLSRSIASGDASTVHGLARQLIASAARANLEIPGRAARRVIEAYPQDSQVARAALDEAWRFVALGCQLALRRAPLAVRLELRRRITSSWNDASLAKAELASSPRSVRLLVRPLFVLASEGISPAEFFAQSIFAIECPTGRAPVGAFIGYDDLPIDLAKVLAELMSTGTVAASLAGAPQSGLADALRRTADPPRSTDGFQYLRTVELARLIDAYAEELDSYRRRESVRPLEISQGSYSRLHQCMDRLSEDSSAGAIGAARRAASRLLDVPIKPAILRLRGMATEVASRLDKKISLVVGGDELMLPRERLTAVQDSLIHLVRNAVDHGIERPATRVANGKPENGTIRIDIRDGADGIDLLVRDDGAGVDADEVVSKAVSKGVVDIRLASVMTDSQKLGLVFTPGFSTRDEATDISGRGVGLDVVARNAARLGGGVELRSEKGRFTEFRLRIGNEDTMTGRDMPTNAAGAAAEVKKLVRQTSVGRLSRYARREGLEILDLSQDPAVLSHWMTLVLVSSAPIRVVFKAHFGSEEAAGLAAPLFGVEPSKLSPEQGADFMKEFCNLTAGAIKRSLSAAGIQSGISLPLLTRGFDEIFFPMANEVTVFNDRWEIRDGALRIFCSVMIEIFDEAPLAGIGREVPEPAESEGEVSFL